jgi:hypothetical protein
MKRNKAKLIALIILVVALCMACHRVEQKKDESTVIQKIEKQWAEEYDIYRLPKEASLDCLKV